MLIRIENVNEEGEVYDTKEIEYSRFGNRIALNDAVKDAIQTMADFPNDSVEIRIVSL